MTEGSNRVTKSPARLLAACAALALVGGLVAAPAPAAAQKQPAPKTKPDDVKADAAAPQDNTPWVKLCSKDTEQRNVCLIAKEFRGPDGGLVASVALRDIEGEAKKVLLIAVPPVVLIQPGMRIGVDKGKQEEAKYTICFPNACYAELTLSDQMLGSLAKGKVLNVTSLNIQQKPMSFPFPLSTFKTAYDGPGIDPTAQQQSQDQLQDELQKRAEEAAKKLGAAAGAGAAPVPPAKP